MLIEVYNDEMDEFFEEIGLCYIASFLRDKGYNVLLMKYIKEIG